MKRTQHGFYFSFAIQTNLWARVLTVDTWYVFSCAQTAIAWDVAETWDGIYDIHSNSVLHQMRYHVDYLIREREQLPLAWSLNERENVQRKFDYLRNSHRVFGISFPKAFEWTRSRKTVRPFVSEWLRVWMAIDVSRILFSSIEPARFTANNNNNNCSGRKRRKFIHWFMFICSNTPCRNDFRTQKMVLLIN